MSLPLPPFLLCLPAKHVAPIAIIPAIPTVPCVCPLTVKSQSYGNDDDQWRLAITFAYFQPSWYLYICEGNSDFSISFFLRRLLHHHHRRHHHRRRRRDRLRRIKPSRHIRGSLDLALIEKRFDFPLIFQYYNTLWSRITKNTN